jgi:hypothetical protein
MVNKDEVAAVVASLCEFYDGIAEITMESRIRRTVILAHGWYVTILRTSQAILILEARSLGHEAAPLRRSLIEHSLGLVWLSEATEDAVNSVLGRYKNMNLKNLREGVENFKDSLGDDYLKLREALSSVLDFAIEGSSEDQFLRFKHLCDRFRVRRMYMAWLRYTGLSHPTYASACAYIRGSGDNAELAREPTQTTADSMQEMVGLLLLATAAMNRLVQGQPWNAILNEIEAKLAEAVSFQTSTVQ